MTPIECEERIRFLRTRLSVRSRELSRMNRMFDEHLKQHAAEMRLMDERYEHLWNIVDTYKRIAEGRTPWREAKEQLKQLRAYLKDLKHPAASPSLPEGSQPDTISRP